MSDSKSRSEGSLCPDELQRRLRERAALLQHLREFMAGRGIMEVEAPVLADAPNWDPSVDFFSVPLGEGRLAYLQSSPESAMKRLLAAGSGPIYSMGKVFRRDERGRWHEPEFTMLEWYRPDFSRQQLQEEVSALLSSLGIPAPSSISYQQAFTRYVGIDPYTSKVTEVEAVARQHGGTAVPNCTEYSEWLDWLLTTVVIPAHGSEPFFLCDYPSLSPVQAALLPEPPPRTDRFELFIDGMEIANGCSELRDAEEFTRRYQWENECRHRRGEEELPMDHGVLSALRRGLPPCAGVALGVDRLLLALNKGKKLTDLSPFS